MSIQHRLSLLCVFLSFPVLSLFAQATATTFHTTFSTASPFQNVEDLHRQLKTVQDLGADYSFAFVSNQKDALAWEHYRFQPTYQGIPIKDKTYIAHLYQGQLHSLNGDLLPTIDASPVPTISAETAFDIALRSINASLYKWEIPSEEARLQQQYDDPQKSYFPEAQLFWFPNERGQYRLAYYFDIYAHLPLERSAVYIDAQNGEQLATYSQFHYCTTPVTVATLFSGDREIILQEEGDDYILEDCSRGNGIRTFDVSIDENAPFSQSIMDWNSIPGTPQQANWDVHFGAAQVYDYLQAIHQRNSIDDAGLALISHTNADIGYNGLWDGDKMIYSPGNATFPSPTSVTVCGHEITHGLVQYTAALSNATEQRGLNESFADIFAVYVDHYTFPDLSIDSLYIIGEELRAGGFRNIQTPSLFDQPSTYQGEFWMANAASSITSVHSHAYYILAEGKTGTNDLGDEYEVIGIGKEKAEQIAYRTLSVYLTSSADLVSASTLSIQAAEDLYGPCSFEYKQVENAWYAVGLGMASTCVNTPVRELANTATLRLSPNPANTFLQLQWEREAVQPRQVRVYNSLGKNIWQGFTAGMHLRVEALQDWPAGLYWVEVEEGRQRTLEKLVVWR